MSEPTFAGYSPWKFPAEINSRLSAITIYTTRHIESNAHNYVPTGLSRAEFISVVRIPRTNVSVSVTMPWTWGMHRRVYASCTRCLFWWLAARDTELLQWTTWWANTSYLYSTAYELLCFAHAHFVKTVTATSLDAESLLIEMTNRLAAFQFAQQ